MKNIVKRYFGLSTLFLSIAFFCCTLCFVNGAKAQPKVLFTTLLSNLSSPVEVRNAGDGSNRLFIVEQGGKIKIYKNGTVLSSVFLDVSSLLSGAEEQGLLSLAFSPDYKNDRTFYIYYTALSDAITVARYSTSETNPDSAIANSAKILFSIPKEGGSVGRNGGDMHFGKDGYLYIGTGDGGTGTNTFNNPQDGNSLLGKMLRINVNNSNIAPYYTIPADNPFVANPNIRDEIWALGLRQPWRWSFDGLTGDMWIGDVGQSKWEEVDFIPASHAGGVNHGWECYEGDSINKAQVCPAVTNYLPPVFAYGHNFNDGGAVVIGGYVYRGALYTTLQGYYICIDYFSKNLWKIKPAESGTGWDVYLQKGVPNEIESFGEGEDGELYATTIGGLLYKVSADEVLPVKFISFTAQQAQATGVVTLKWQTGFEQNIESFQVQSSTDGRIFSAIGTVTAKNLNNGFTYSYNHSQPLTGKVFYRLVIKSKDGTISYSDVINIMQSHIPRAVIYPTVVESNTITVVLNDKFSALRMFDLSGREVMYKSLTGETGTIILRLPKLTAGTYAVQLTGVYPFQQKIVVTR